MGKFALPGSTRGRCGLDSVGFHARRSPTGTIVIPDLARSENATEALCPDNDAPLALGDEPPGATPALLPKPSPPLMWILSPSAASEAKVRFRLPMYSRRRVDCI
jgi:hypothetical protein